MKLIVKVEKHGIRIPIERLKGINKGDLVQIEIERLYMSKRTQKRLREYLSPCLKVLSISE